MCTFQNNSVNIQHSIVVTVLLSGEAPVNDMKWRSGMTVVMETASNPTAIHCTQLAWKKNRSTINFKSNVSSHRSQFTLAGTSLIQSSLLLLSYISCSV